MDIVEELEAAEADVNRLRRLIATKPCREVGHRWKHFGGSNAGCGRDCACSIPVHVCEVCGDCDYGENAEADKARVECAERRAELAVDDNVDFEPQS